MRRFVLIYIMVYNELMIKSDINIRFGAPRIDGSRLTVSDILGYISGGDTFETLIHNFPELNKEKIQMALDYALSTVNNTPIISPHLV